MIKEYYKFIKDYLKLAEIKPLYLTINIVTAFLYKLFELLLPLIGSFIVRYLTLNNSHMVFVFLIIFAIDYFLYYAALYANYRIYGYNISYCYNRLTKKVFDKLSTVDGNFTKSFSKGRIMNTINSDVITIGDMNDRVSEVITGIVQIIMVLIIVANNNIIVSIVLIIFALFYIAFRNSCDRLINIYHNKVQIYDDKYSTLLTQIVSGLQEIKTFNMLDKLKLKLNDIQKKFTKNYSLKGNIIP